MNRWLILGAGGMLGRDLADVLSADPEVDLTAATRSNVDLLDAAQVRRAVEGTDVVVNAAAWTDVDGAESKPDDAMACNGDAVGKLAEACAEAGSLLIHVSTDYVFPGTAIAPYAEDSPTSPVNEYGRSKLAGEQHVLNGLPEAGYVVRTAWLYGAHGNNFVTTMLRLAASKDTVDVVDDQIGQPTWSGALAHRLVELGRSGLSGVAPAGVYHGTASGETTWFGLARAVFALSGLDPGRVRPTTSDSFVRPAPRPGYSVLGHERWKLAGLPAMDGWHDMLSQALTSEGVMPASSHVGQSRIHR